MPSTYTDNLRLEIQANGENDDTWNNIYSTVFNLIEDAIAGLVSVDLSAGDATLTATNGAADQARSAMIKVIGTLTANRNIVVPTATKHYLVWNATSGAFTVTVKTAAGTGQTVAQGEKQWAFCDGTNVLVMSAGGTSAATPNALVLRDSAGRAQVVDPSAGADIATKAYADARLPSGSNMLFNQAAAPTGWTQDVATNDRVIRVVSGSGAVNGGSWTVSGISSGSLALSIAQMPVHTVNVTANKYGGDQGSGGPFTSSGTNLTGPQTIVSEPVGGGAGHAHSIASDATWRPAYRDVIAATRN